MLTRVLQGAALAQNVGTFFDISPGTIIYDRYSVTEQWVTYERVSGRPDLVRKISHHMITYYYCTDDGNGGSVWRSCGGKYTFTEEIFPG